MFDGNTNSKNKKKYGFVVHIVCFVKVSICDDLPLSQCNHDARKVKGSGLSQGITTIETLKLLLLINLT